MTELRQRMIQDMILAGLTLTTQANYVRAVAQLAGHYGVSPDRLTEEQVRASTCSISSRPGTPPVALFSTNLEVSAFSTSKRSGATGRCSVKKLLTPRQKRLPRPVAHDDFLALTRAVQQQHYRLAFALVYARGPRIGEVTNLPVSAVDSKRMAPTVEANLPIGVWNRGWNVFCKPWGAHAESTVEYLGRYIFRAAISNAPIEAMDRTRVTFRFKSGRKGQGRSRLRPRGEEFPRRFVMHVLPRGFQKVRYYGLWRHGKSDARKRIAEVLRLKTREKHKQTCVPESTDAAETWTDLLESQEPNRYLLDRPLPVTCPRRSSAPVHLNAEIRRRNRSP